MSLHAGFAAIAIGLKRCNQAREFYSPKPEWELEYYPVLTLCQGDLAKLDYWGTRLNNTALVIMVCVAQWPVQGCPREVCFHRRALTKCGFKTLILSILCLHFCIILNEPLRVITAHMWPGSIQTGNVRSTLGSISQELTDGPRGYFCPAVPKEVKTSH